MNKVDAHKTGEVSLINILYGKTKNSHNISLKLKWKQQRHTQKKSQTFDSEHKRYQIWCVSNDKGYTAELENNSE